MNDVKRKAVLQEVLRSLRAKYKKIDEEYEKVSLKHEELGKQLVLYSKERKRLLFKVEGVVDILDDMDDAPDVVDKVTFNEPLSPQDALSFSFQIGSKVQLKSGGPAMVVIKIVNDKFTCVWERANGGLNAHAFHGACLRPHEEEKLQ